VPLENVTLVHESRSDPRHGDFRDRVREAAARRAARPGDPRLTIVNLGFYYPLYPDDFRPYRAGPDSRLVYDAPLWLGHPVYTFEGNTIEERRIFDVRRYRVSIYLDETRNPGTP
jgi:hypothetical protein